jgi:hypothetical protein
MTAPGVRQGTKRDLAQQEAAQRAQPITAAMQQHGVSPKVHNLAGALQYARALYEHGVYAVARRVYSDPWWGCQRLKQHGDTQQYYRAWFNQLLQLQPAECPGPIVVMYGNARWGHQRGWGGQSPVRSMVRRMAHEPGFVVYMVDEFRTSCTHWETGNETSVVQDEGGNHLRQLLRVSDIHGPAHYVDRDVNSAIQMLIAGLLPARLPHLRREQREAPANKEAQSRMRHPGRPRDPRAVQAAVTAPARLAARAAVEGGSDP